MKFFYKLNIEKYDFTFPSLFFVYNVAKFALWNKKINGYAMLFANKRVHGIAVLSF